MCLISEFVIAPHCVVFTDQPSLFKYNDKLNLRVKYKWEKQQFSLEQVHAVFSTKRFLGIFTQVQMASNPTNPVFNTKSHRP